MAFKLASLFVNLSADSTELQTEFKKSKKSANTWKKDMEKIGKTAGASLKTVTVAAGVATTGLAALYAVNASALDELGKSAAKLGESATGMREIGLASEYGGVGMSTMTSALVKMTDSVSGAVDGTGSVSKAIKELGLDAAVLARLRPSEQFELITQALEGVENQNDRVRLSMDFYGKTGADLLNVTSSAIKQAKDDVDALNRAFGEIDPSGIEAANDAVTRLGTIGTTAGQVFTQKMAPAVEVIANQLFEAATQSDQLGKVIDAVVITSLQGVAGMLGATASIVSFVDGKGDDFQFGALGYLILGKKGVALGLAMKSVVDVFDSTVAAAKNIYTDLTSDDPIKKLRADIAELEADIDLREGFIFEGIFNFIDDGGTEKLNKELDAKVSQLNQLESIALNSFESVPSLLDETASKSVDTSRVIVDAALSAQQIVLASIDALQNGVITPPTLLAPTKSELVAPTAPTASGLGSSVDTSIVEDDPLLTSELLRFSAIESAQTVHLENVKAANDAARAEEAFFQESHGQYLTGLIEGSSKDKLKAGKAYYGGELEALSQYSRKAFEVNKALNVGNAIMNISEGITKALALPFPKNFLVGAKVALAGAVELLRIKNTKFGGSGSVAAPSTPSVSDSSADTAPVAEIDEQATAEANPTGNTYILNGLFSKTDALDIVADQFKTANETGLISIVDGQIDTRNIIGSAA